MPNARSRRRPAWLRPSEERASQSFLNQFDAGPHTGIHEHECTNRRCEGIGNIAIDADAPGDIAAAAKVRQHCRSNAGPTRTARRLRAPASRKKWLRQHRAKPEAPQRHVAGARAAVGFTATPGMCACIAAAAAVAATSTYAHRAAAAAADRAVAAIRVAVVGGDVADPVNAHT